MKEKLQSVVREGLEQFILKHIRQLAKDYEVLVTVLVRPTTTPPEQKSKEKIK